MTISTPPGQVSDYSAARLLVLAPHYDDETLACGGLLARLAGRDAVIRVLFLSDGGGAVREPELRSERCQLRRTEAMAALAELGVPPEAAVHLDLPDGELAECIDVLSERLRGEIAELRPDLLLCPSGLEASSDHRAAFAALHRVVSSPEAEPEWEALLRAMRILLYELNRPGYPDRLLDVGAELPRIEAAIACYRSQLADHDYGAAALGLRRYRTLSLPPGVLAAEGYRELAIGELRSRSLPTLIRHLGGAPEALVVEEGPKISVIVRTLNRPELLREALDSVAQSSYPRLEVLVVNDGGEPPTLPTGFPWPLQRIDLPENRGRATAAQTGVDAATGDALAFLDDDDRVEPEHYAVLAGAVGAAGIRVAYSDAAVGVYEPGRDGWLCVERRLPYRRDFDRDRLVVDNYIPFHTLLVERALLAEVGPFDPELPFFEDWDLLVRLARRVDFHHVREVTCEYRHFRGSAHHALGNDPRSRGDFLALKAKVLAKHQELLTPELLARVVDSMRAEAVAEREGAEVAHRSLRELEEQFHRQRGELVARTADGQRLEGEIARLQELEGELRRANAGHLVELERLYREEERLHGQIAAQGEEAGRLYAEIERLQETIDAMEGSRAWRLATWWRRLRT